MALTTKRPPTIVSPELPFLKSPPVPRPPPQCLEINTVIFKSKKAKDATEKLRKELRINWDYKKAPDINVSEEITQLHKAAIEGNLDEVKRFISEGVNPNAKDADGYTILHHVMKSTQVPVLSYLLLEVPDVDLNVQDLGLRTPLHYACHRQKQESELSDEERAGLMATCSLILGDPRVHVDAKDKRGRTPLCIATRDCLFSVVSMLISRNANPNIADNLRRTPLHYACIKGQKDICEALYEAGAWIEAKDDSGLRPIHFAAKHNHLAICRYLKKIGATLDCYDNYGKTPHTLTTNSEIKWLIEARFTSTTHPLKVDFVKHKVLGKARIGMSMCPGRNKKNWRRDLADDMKVLKSHGIKTVVSLVCQEELDAMGIPNLHMKLNEQDIETVHFQIKDKWVPNSMDDLVAIIELMLVRIERQRCILVHCNGGKGRTGLVVVSTLVALGVSVDEAVSVTRKAREGMIQNPAQLIYVRAFKQHWFGMERMAPKGIKK